ncbi:MAG: YbjQ family protein [Acidimicrobiia bacterium]
MTADTTSPGALPVTTALEFPSWEIERFVGPVFGLIVRSMGFAKGIGAGFKSLAGGEVHQYTELLEDSRRHALDRMVENARLIGANAVISMRFDSSEIGQSLTEIVAYGTGVIVGAKQ